MRCALTIQTTVVYSRPVYYPLINGESANALQRPGVALLRLGERAAAAGRMSTRSGQWDTLRSKAGSGSAAGRTRSVSGRGAGVRVAGTGGVGSCGSQLPTPVSDAVDPRC